MPQIDTNVRQQLVNRVRSTLGVAKVYIDFCAEANPVYPYAVVRLERLTPVEDESGIATTMVEHRFTISFVDRWTNGGLSDQKAEKINALHDDLMSSAQFTANAILPRWHETQMVMDEDPDRGVWAVVYDWSVYVEFPTLT